MLYFINSKRILLLLILCIFSINAYAKAYHYRADVKGMVCAFCAYSVAKNIRKLPTVEADSVNVNLKNNLVEFTAYKKVSQRMLSPLFEKSGFTLEHLIMVKTLAISKKLSGKARLDLSIDVFETDQFTSLLKILGDIAIKKPSRIRVEAPEEQEGTILKALLMGRKHVVQVFFIPNDDINRVHIQLFDVFNGY